MSELSRRETAAPSNEPDAELLRLNAEDKAFLSEIEDGQHRDAKGDLPDEALIHMCGLERKIAAAPADTYAGISIKLRIAVNNFASIDPGMTRDSIGLNVKSALADAERLAGGAI